MNRTNLSMLEVQHSVKHDQTRKKYSKYSEDYLEVDSLFANDWFYNNFIKRIVLVQPI